MAEDSSEKTEVRSDGENPFGKKLANGHPVVASEQKTLFLQRHLITGDICETVNRPEGNKRTQSGLLCGCRWCFVNRQGDSRISSLLLRTDEKLRKSRQRSASGNKWKCSIIVLSVLLLISVTTNICLLAKPHLLAAAPHPPDASPCPQGWVRNEGRCYFFSDSEATWNASRINCSSQGGSLVAMDTPQEWAFVSQSKRPRYYWIGLWRTEVGELWKWANGSLFNNWFPVGGEGLCAYLSKDVASSTWCDKHRYWICSKHLHGNT